MTRLIEEAVQDLDWVRYVTANYNHLQGLRKVPIGLFLFLLLTAPLLLTRIWQPKEDAVVSTL